MHLVTVQALCLRSWTLTGALPDVMQKKVPENEVKKVRSQM
jgi:hypothetical protein